MVSVLVVLVLPVADTPPADVDDDDSDAVVAGVVSIFSSFFSGSAFSSFFSSGFSAGVAEASVGLLSEVSAGFGLGWKDELLFLSNIKYSSWAISHVNLLFTDHKVGTQH